MEASLSSWERQTCCQADAPLLLASACHPSRHRAAAEQYSRAIACKVEDDKYNAVLYLNRGACLPGNE